MSGINDAKKAAFLAEGIAEGSLNDMELAWLQSLGVTSDNLVDAWKEYLILISFSGNALPDNENRWLGSKGFTGTLPDRRLKAWSEGAPVSLQTPLLLMPLSSDLSLTEGTGSVSLTRSSIGTYRDKDDGLVKTAAIDTARFETDGFLSEGDSTNLALHSRDYNNAAYTKDFVTIATNAVTAPDGTVGADTVTETVATDVHRFHQTITTTATATTVSIDAEPNGRDWIYLQISDSGATSRKAFFDITNGVSGTLESGMTAKITALTGGYYRCEATIATALAGAAPVFVGLASSDNTPSYTGDGASGAHFDNFQVEGIMVASSSIITTTTAVTRAIDIFRLPAASNINEVQGTISVDMNLLGHITDINNFIFSIDDNDTTNRYTFFMDTKRLRTFVVAGGVTQADYTEPSDWDLTNTRKLSLVFGDGKVETFADNVSVGSETGITLPTGLLNINFNTQVQTRAIFGHYRNFRIDDRQLTSAERALL